MSKDQTDLYASGILQQNISKVYKSNEKITGSTSYPTHHMAPENNMCTQQDESKLRDRIGALDSIAKQEISSLITHAKIDVRSTTPTLIFLSLSVTSERISGFEVFQYYKQHSLEGNKIFQ